MLPSSLTNLFSADEKNKIKTNHESITPDKLLIKYIMNVVMVIEKKEELLIKKH